MNSATQTLRPYIDRVRRAWQGSPLPAFFAWWGGELRALLPTRWQRFFAGGAVWYLLQHRDDQWVLRRAGESQTVAQWNDLLDPTAQQAALTTALAGVDRLDLRLAFCLPASAVLRRGLVLPEATRDNLRQVGAFEMDRQTPFRTEQVYYDLRTLGGNAPPGRIRAELVAVPRTVLDASLERLRESGIAIDAADVDEGFGRSGVNLLPPEQTRVRSDPRRRFNLALLAGAVVLVLLCLNQYLRNREEALGAMQTQVDGMRNDAQQIAALRKQLEDSVGASGFLARRKTASTTIMDVLQDLTTRMPDDTFLERFTATSSGQLGIQGQSDKAASLIDVMQHSKLITNTSFQGVIQRDINSR